MGSANVKFLAVEADFGFLIVKQQNDDSFKQYATAESLAEAKVITAALNRFYENTAAVSLPPQ